MRRKEGGQSIVVEREKKQVNGNLSIISNALRQEKLKKKNL